MKLLIILIQYIINIIFFCILHKLILQILNRLQFVESILHAPSPHTFLILSQQQGKYNKPWIYPPSKKLILAFAEWLAEMEIETLLPVSVLTVIDKSKMFFGFINLEENFNAPSYSLFRFKRYYLITEINLHRSKVCSAQQVIDDFRQDFWW